MCVNPNFSFFEFAPNNTLINVGEELISSDENDFFEDSITVTSEDIITYFSDEDASDTSKDVISDTGDDDVITNEYEKEGDERGLESEPGFIKTTNC